MNSSTAGNPVMSERDIRRTVYTRLLLMIPIIGLVLFLPAGTLRYWEAWVYLAILLIPMFFVMRYFLKHDPAFLARRMRMREKETPQRRISALSIPCFLLIFVLPGLDHRFGWSAMPVAVVLAADLLVLLGYAVILRVFRENRYASRIVEVEKGQHVIHTGPYAVVRHPMYLGVALMYTASPVALGSWWALLPALLILPILVARILNEEKLLMAELPGYVEYRQRTRYRLIPGIW